MFFLQATKDSTVSTVLFLGTLGMLVLTISLVVFIIMHQRRVIRFQNKLTQMEQEQQKILFNASIKLQEEERQRLAADLHDDAGPLLATARLYLTKTWSTRIKRPNYNRFSRHGKLSTIPSNSFGISVIA